MVVLDDIAGPTDTQILLVPFYVVLVHAQLDEKFIELSHVDLLVQCRTLDIAFLGTEFPGEARTLGSDHEDALAMGGVGGEELRSALFVNSMKIEPQCFQATLLGCNIGGYRTRESHGGAFLLEL